MATRPTPEECANCGAAIPRHAKACPECGADERTGWREASIYDGLDLPEEAWRGDSDAAGETKKPSRARVNGLPWYYWAAALALILLLLGGVLARR